MTTRGKNFTSGNVPNNRRWLDTPLLCGSLTNSMQFHGHKRGDLLEHVLVHDLAYNQSHVFRHSTLLRP